MITSQDIKAAAKRLGADIVGIGSIDRWSTAPIQMDPKQIMPRAKSIIALGFRVFRGSLRGIEEGTYFSNYSAMGYGGITYLYMPMTVINLSKMIEDAGYEAVPMGHQSDWRAIDNVGYMRPDYSRPVAPGKAAPDVMINLRIAGFLCGLGEIGYSKMLLTPEFGPRVRVGIIITELELEPDPIMEPGTLCNRCMACARECVPATAFPRIAPSRKTWSKRLQIPRTPSAAQNNKKQKAISTGRGYCLLFFILERVKSKNYARKEFIALSLYQRALDHTAMHRGGSVGENSVRLLHGFCQIFLSDAFGHGEVGIGACVFVTFLAAEGVFLRPVARLAIGRDPFVVLSVQGDLNGVPCAKRARGARLDASLAVFAVSGDVGILRFHDLIKRRIGDNGDKILAEAMLRGIAHTVESERADARFDSLKLIAKCVRKSAARCSHISADTCKVVGSHCVIALTL